MNYTQYYMDAKNASDQISAGEYTRPDRTGFIERKEQERPEESIQDKILNYMAMFRSPLPEGSDNRAMTFEDDHIPTPLGGSVDIAIEALASVESKGSGDYAALGPVMKSGMYKGQRAIGRYQVMEGNIPSWTKEALGMSLTVDEFYNNKSAQDAVVAHQLRKSYKKYGTWEDAASVWFSGRPLAKAGNASDGFTTVPEYVKKFRNYFNMLTESRS